MYRVTKNIAISVALLIAAAVAATFMPALVSSQTPKSAALPPAKPGQYLGVLSCSSGSGCHGSKSVDSADPKFRVRLNEYFIWKGKDSHANAYTSLSTAKARDIVRHVERIRNQDPRKVELCLNCHALPTMGNSPNADQGVSCEACHGPASGWLSTHAEAKRNTRELSIAAKMTDLWNPKVRAKTCLGCHLGNVDKPDMHVDHELIAAGHPDLRFELDNYGDKMRHWVSFRQRANKSGYEETEGARAWIIGQAVAFGMGLQRLADRARKTESWPEYAELDCYSCHHSLQEKSWRQPTSKRDNIGLPPWSRARFVMMRHIVAVFAPDRLKTIDENANKLATAVHNSSGAEVAKLATSLELTMKKVTEDVEKTKAVDIKQTRQFVDLIVKEINLVSVDIRAAEQAVLAVSSLAAELAYGTPKERIDELESALRALERVTAMPASYNPGSFTAAMRRVQELLNRIGAGK